MLEQVHFVFLIKLFKPDSMESYNVKVLRQNEAPVWAKNTHSVVMAYNYAWK